MKALVLSAGYGERLRPLTNTIPKPLVEIAGRPLIHYPLLLLRHAGIRNVAVNVHHLAERIEAVLGRGDALGLQITYSPEPVLLGTGGPLLSLREYFGKEPFVVLNCDTIMDLDLAAMIKAHREHGGMATLVLRAADSPAAYSAIEVDTTGQIRRMRLLVDRAAGRFDNYPAVLHAEIAAGLTPFMYCGAMVCEPAVLEKLPLAPPFSLMSDLFAPLLVQGSLMFGHVHRGYFRTVDDLKAYEQLRSEFAVSPPPLPYIQ